MPKRPIRYTITFFLFIYNAKHVILYKRFEEHQRGYIFISIGIVPPRTLYSFKSATAILRRFNVFASTAILIMDKDLDIQMALVVRIAKGKEIKVFNEYLK